jgi:hypothetical protein
MIGKARHGKTRQDLGNSSFILTFEMDGSATDSGDGFEDEDTGFEVKRRRSEREEIRSADVLSLARSADDFSLAVMTRCRRIIFRWSCFAPFLTSGSQANKKRRREKRQNTRQKKVQDQDQPLDK